MSTIGAPGVKLKGSLNPPMGADEKEKMIFELQDRLTQAEKNKEIMATAKDVEAKSGRMAKARYEAQIKELNFKIEKMEQELREKTQESKIASSRLRELQSSGNGLPVKREK